MIYQFLWRVMGSLCQIKVKFRAYDETMLMAPKGFPLKHCLGLIVSLQGWMGGSIHEEASSGTIKVNLKVDQSKGRSPRTSQLNVWTITSMIKGRRIEDLTLRTLPSGAFHPSLAL